MKTRRLAGSLLAALAVLAIWRWADHVPPAVAGGRLELGSTRTHLVGSGVRVEARTWSHSHGAGGGRIWIATIDPAKTRLSIVPAVEPKPLHAVLAGTRGEAVAINGGFYDTSGEPLGLVLSGQRVLHPVGNGSGVFVIGSTGASIVHVDSFERRDAWYALQSTDRLVENGKSLVKDRDGLPRDARSIAAVDRDGKVILAVMVDERAVASDRNGRIRLGRKSTTTGPTLPEMAELLARPRDEGGLGAIDALNLDGGFSTAFHVKIGGEEIVIEGYRGTINAVRAVPLSTPIPTFAATR